MPDLKHLFILLLLMLEAPISFGQQETRFRITENGKIGYIDPSGKVLIPPVYLNGADFSEGLAAVRMNGKYGFIDLSGNWVIPPIYDFADSFDFGFACVYTDGKAILIDHRGKNVLQNKDYRNIRLISSNRAVVKTVDGKFTFIDIRRKKQLLDEKMLRINEFNEGVAVVSGKNKSKSDFYGTRCAVIDTNGHFVVNFGVYSEIKDFVQGYALVEWYENDEVSFDGVIDTKGKLVFSRKKTDSSYLFYDFHDGLAVIAFNNYWMEEQHRFSTGKKDYSGYLNLKGEIVLNDTLNRHLDNFSGGRTFIRTREGKYQLYDTHCRPVTAILFDEFTKPGFRNGIAAVRKNRLWTLIDSSGNYLFEPKFEEIAGIDHEQQLLIYVNDAGESKNRRFGIANFKGEPLGEANMQRISYELFENGLLLAMVDERLCYINISGAMVWQEETENPEQIIPLNTEYMTSGYFTAFSEEDDADLGGFGTVMNSARKITGKPVFESNKLSILVENIPDTLFYGHPAFRVYVANTSESTIRFGAQDSRLYMNVQAKDSHGKWRDIEHLPNSWCGNSYHTLKLAPDTYWPFVTPAYAGEFQTRLRIKLEYAVKKGTGKEEIRTIYSNEYSGSVNPGQFWNKDHHVPTGIMDPYSY